MTRDEIIAFWGSKLKRWPEVSLKDVMIPASSKSFLRDVGLPSGADWTLRFDPQPRLLPRLPGKPHYRQFGNDDVVPLCLDEQRDGRVVAVESEIGGHERYINSNVELFGDCLVYYQHYRLSVRDLREDQVQGLIETTEQRARNADPTAFDNANNWWPVIFDQMNQGLL